MSVDKENYAAGDHDGKRWKVHPIGLDTGKGGRESVGESSKSEYGYRKHDTEIIKRRLNEIDRNGKINR